MKWIVYAHYRLDTGECFYIGKGTEKRSQDKHNRNSYWKRIESKAGRRVVILEYFLIEKEAFQYEKDLIKLYRPCANLTDGGEGDSGRIVSQETRVKHKLRWLKIWSNPEFRSKRTNELRLMAKNPDIIKKCSQGRINFFKNEKNRLKHSIATGGKPFFVFKNSTLYSEEVSIIEFARKNKLHHTNICSCLKGKRKSTGGFSFKYKE